MRVHNYHFIVSESIVFRSIATLAITTLLKTGAESSVERLMKQISSFVSEISDEFKVRFILLVFLHVAIDKQK